MLAGVVLTLAIVFNVAEGVQRALPHPTTTCQAARDAKYGLQVGDVWASGSGRIEHDAGTRLITGPRTSYIRTALAFALFDAAADYLTRHSARARCDADIAQGAMNLHGIIYSGDH